MTARQPLPSPEQIEETAAKIRAAYADAVRWAADARAVGADELAANLEYLARQYQRISSETAEVAVMHRTEQKTRRREVRR